MPNDPYSQYLGLPQGKRPPRSHELLGIPADTHDAAAIEAAAAKRMDQLDHYALSSDRATRDQVQRLMNEVAKARTRLVARIPKPTPDLPAPSSRPAKPTRPDRPAAPTATQPPRPTPKPGRTPSEQDAPAPVPAATAATATTADEPAKAKPTAVFWSLVAAGWAVSLVAVFAVTFALAKPSPTEPGPDLAANNPGGVAASPDPDPDPDPDLDPESDPAKADTPAQDPAAESPQPTGPSAEVLAEQARQAEVERLAAQARAEQQRLEQARQQAEAERLAEQQRLAEEQARAEQARQQQEKPRQQQIDDRLAELQAEQAGLREELSAAQAQLRAARARMREHQAQGTFDRAESERYEAEASRYQLAAERYRTETERLRDAITALRNNPAQALAQQPTQQPPAQPQPQQTAPLSPAEQARADQLRQREHAQYLRSRAQLKGKPLAQLIVNELAKHNPRSAMTINVKEDGSGNLTGIEIFSDPAVIRAGQGVTLVTDLSALEGLKLRSLKIENFKSLKTLDALKGMPLEQLNIKRCPGLEDIAVLKGMPIKVLEMSELPIADLEPLRGMPLEYLWCTGCPNITSTAPLKGTPIQMLFLNGCTSLADLSGLDALSAAEGEVALANTAITDLGVLRRKSIKWLNLTGCHQLRSLDGLEGATIGHLHLDGLDMLEDISALPKIRVTDKFVLASPKVDTFKYLSNLRAKTVVLDCGQVTSLRGLENLAKLEVLDLAQMSHLSPEEVERATARYRDIEIIKPQ